MVQNPGGIKGDAADYYDTSSAVIAQNDSSSPDGMAQFILPFYGVESRSGTSGLTTVGVAREIYINYRRGRLTLFEIARRKRPWTSVLLKSKDRVKLDKPASKLDRAIWELQHDANSSGQVGIPFESWDFHTQTSSESNEELLEMSRKMVELVLNDSEIKAFLGKLFAAQRILSVQF